MSNGPTGRRAFDDDIDLDGDIRQAGMFGQPPDDTETKIRLERPYKWGKLALQVSMAAGTDHGRAVTQIERILDETGARIKHVLDGLGNETIIVPVDVSQRGGVSVVETGTQLVPAGRYDDPQEAGE